MNKTKKLQRKIAKVDCEIERLVAYYFLLEDSFTGQSIDLAGETALAHPEPAYHIPGNSLDILHTDVRQVKSLIMLLMKKTHLKKNSYG